MMNDFGIADSRMLGYWLENTPVTPDSATAEGDELGGLAPGTPLVRAYAPAVEGIQAAAELDLSAVPVPAGQGLFVVVQRLPGPPEGG